MSGWRPFFVSPVNEKQPPPAHFSFPLIYDRTSLTYFFEPVKSRVEPIGEFFEPFRLCGVRVTGLLKRGGPKRKTAATRSFFVSPNLRPHFSHVLFRARQESC